jgi:hypothetical protein
MVDVQTRKLIAPVYPESLLEMLCFLQSKPESLCSIK